jgi:hypothetical protein
MLEKLRALGHEIESNRRDRPARDNTNKREYTVKNSACQS